MSTHIHVSGLSYFCTDDKLRQAFTPVGTVGLAQVLRDECGHSLGLGVVHMACSEDVERVFNEHQHFEVSGSRVDLWEPAEPEDAQAERIMAFTLQETPAAQTGQDTAHEKKQKALKPLTVRRPSLIRSQARPLLGPPNTNSSVTSREPGIVDPTRLEVPMRIFLSQCGWHNPHMKYNCYISSPSQTDPPTP